MDYKKLLPKNISEKLEAARWHVTDFVRRASKDIPPDSIVLDAGAGECWYKPFFDDKKYFACDFGKGKKAWDYGNLDFYCDLSHISIKDKAINAVLATQVLEHLSEPGGFLKEAYRILKPKGKIYLTAPFYGKIHQEPYDFFRYTKYGLKYMLEKAGFEVEELSPHGGYFLCVGNMLIRCHRNLFPKERKLLVKAFTFLIEPFSKIIFTVIIPMLCRMFDRLDNKRLDTLGYSCIANKPEK